MFKIYSKEHRKKRNAKFYKMGRVKTSILSASIFSSTIWVIRAIRSYFSNKTLDIFNIGSLVEVLFLFLLWYVVAYYLNWSIIAEKHEKYSEHEKQ